MSIAQPDLDANPWASGAAEGDISTPSYGQQLAGFTPTIAAPPYQWMNWVLKQTSTLGRYLRSRGIPDYNSAEQYSKGDVVQVAGATVSTVYQCKVTPPFNGFATDNTTYWEIYGVSWIPDAIKTALAESLPPLIHVALRTLFGFSSNLEIDHNGDPVAGTIRWGGWQLSWVNYSFTIGAGSVPQAGSVTWDMPFGAIYGVMATPIDYHLVVSIPHWRTTGADIVPTVIGTLTWMTASTFILAIGSAPTS